MDAAIITLGLLGKGWSQVGLGSSLREQRQHRRKQLQGQFRVGYQERFLHPEGGQVLEGAEVGFQSLEMLSRCVDVAPGDTGWWHGVNGFTRSSQRSFPIKLFCDSIDPPSPFSARGVLGRPHSAINLFHPHVGVQMKLFLLQ